MEGEGERLPQTREIAHAIIKDTLKVDLQGSITACHPLKNRNQVLVKFSDHDDKNAEHGDLSVSADQVITVTPPCPWQG